MIVVRIFYYFLILFADAINDPVFVKDISTIWRLLLAEGISIAAFIDDPNGGKPILAGMNALGIDSKIEKDSISGYEVSSIKLNLIFYSFYRASFISVYKYNYIA